MSIKYVRTMELSYDGDALNDVSWGKMSHELHKKGVSMVGRWDYDNEDSEYGFMEEISSKTTYDIEIDGEHFESFSWTSDANKVVNALNRYFNDEDIEVNMIKNENEKTKKVWKQPANKYCYLEIDGLEGEMGYGAGVHQCFNIDDELVTMQTTIDKSFRTIELKFVVIWNSEKVQRKEIIEKMMVESVLADMGKIQSVVEGRLKLKKFGYDVENPSIDCHFDAITESRSECTPDIIAQVREARNSS